MSKQSTANPSTFLKQRTPYNRLPKGARKIIDYMRRHLAENLAAANGMPVDQALAGITHLHEAGYLTLVEKDGRIELVPSFKDGTVLEGSFDFETAHRNVGGRS